MRPYYKLDDDDRRRQGTYGGFGGRRLSIGAPLTPAVKALIIVNIVIFVLELAVKAQGYEAWSNFLHVFAFDPQLAIRRFWVWQFVTYMFLHWSFLHIALNLFFLWMIGGLAEMGLGTRRFLWLYFVSGAFAALLQGLVWYNSSTVGASGAIMGVAAAAAALNPDMTILFFFILPMKMKYFLWVMVFLQLLGASSSAQYAGQPGSSTAYFAHLGGLAAGYLFVKWHRGFANWWYRVTWRLRALRSRVVRLFVRGKAPESTPIDDEDKYRQEVDRLLDKIFRESTESLTPKEREFLKKQSERYKK